MAHQCNKEHAQILRKAGRSINEIVNALGAKKSTVSYWCRDIALTQAQIMRLAHKQDKRGAIGRLRAAEAKRALRLQNIAHAQRLGESDVGVLSQRDVYMLGLALYWGEGYKKGNEECGITNSDPAIVLLFIRWLKQVTGLDTSALILRVSLNQSHQNRIREVEEYWSQVTKIPREQFTRASIIKTKSKKEFQRPEQHFGTLRVKVRRGTALRRRILGSIKYIQQQIIK